LAADLNRDDRSRAQLSVELTAERSVPPGTQLAPIRELVPVCSFFFFFFLAAMAVQLLTSSVTTSR
jgi:hypothetical protein